MGKGSGGARIKLALLLPLVAGAVEQADTPDTGPGCPRQRAEHNFDLIPTSPEPEECEREPGEGQPAGERGQ